MPRMIRSRHNPLINQPDLLAKPQMANSETTMVRIRNITAHDNIFTPIDGLKRARRPGAQ
jgi:hypothetical protein